MKLFTCECGKQIFCSEIFKPEIEKIICPTCSTNFNMQRFCLTNATKLLALDPNNEWSQPSKLHITLDLNKDKNQLVFFK